jgi:TRAP-type C4-dicarboxylate transport system permease small subunit
MLNALNRVLDRVEETAIVSLMFVATAITVMQVVARYGFNNSLFWAEEVVIYSIICMSFLAASLGVRRGAHITMDLINALGSPAVNRILQIVASLLGILFAISIAWLGTDLFLSTLSRNQLTPSLRLPLAWFYLPIPIAGGLMTIRYASNLIDAWRNPPHSHTEDLVAGADKLA